MLVTSHYQDEKGVLRGSEGEQHRLAYLSSKPRLKLLVVELGSPLVLGSINFGVFVHLLVAFRSRQVVSGLVTQGYDEGWILNLELRKGKKGNIMKWGRRKKKCNLHISSHVIY